MDRLAFRITHIAAYVLRWPVSIPVQTSFGIMLDRPAVFVRVQDASGHVGWGEIWCNFPACGAEHRAKLLQTVVSPIIQNKEFASPQDAFNEMQSRTDVLAIQSGELGPISQVIAGVDLAIWDMLARKAELPLWKFLGGKSDRIYVYASGINPSNPEQAVLKKYAQGYRAFKLKVGFGSEKDLANLIAMRECLPTSTDLMVDANQAWAVDEALAMMEKLKPFDLKWLEEPIRADCAIDDWKQLAKEHAIPLAAGENIVGQKAFSSAIHSKALTYVQPDSAKWGGITGCLPVIKATLDAGLTYCPHYLGGGVGLLASAHLMAAVGGVNAMLEIDSNANPLRTEFASCLNSVEDGIAFLGDNPGIGQVPQESELREFRVI